MNFFDELDFLKIGKFTIAGGKLLPVNYYGEYILNLLSMHLKGDPKNFLDNLISKGKKLFMLGGMKYSVNYSNDVIYIQDLTEYLDDAENFIDLLSLQHEIKNPLTVINGAAQLLQMKSQDSFVTNTADIIFKESKRIQGLLDSISILFNEPNIKEIDIKRFIDDLVGALKLAYPEVTIFVYIDSELSCFYADRIMFYSALFNILKNSCDAKGDCNITISVSFDVSMKMKPSLFEIPLKMLKFSIIDNSGGIKSDELEKIFNPFYTTKSKGSGLGLFIAKNIVDKHKGRVYVNTLYGLGTSFIILVPFYERGEND